MITQQRPDVIVHAAGGASVGASFSAPAKDFHSGVDPWLEILDGIRRSGVEVAAVLLSSAAVYGAAASLPIREDTPLAPISPYGFHKVACEGLSREYATCFGARVANLRIFSVVGPRQRRLLIWDIFRALQLDGRALLQGTGDETRDFLHEEDAARAIVGVAERLLTRLPGALLSANVASGVATPIREVGRLIRDRVGRGTVAFSGETRAGDPPCWQADVAQLRALMPAFKSRPLDAAIDSCVAAWTAPGAGAP